MDYTLLLKQYNDGHPDKGHSQQARLHQCLRMAILDGRLASGATLLSTRQLASDLRIARNSVLHAYEQLAAEALVLTEGRRTRVAPLVLAPAAALKVALPLSHRSRRLTEPLDGVDGSLAREMQSQDARHSAAFVPGVPDLRGLPLAMWRRQLDRAWREATPADLGYASAQGERRLRDVLAQHLRVSRGLRCQPEQIFITDGTQQALQLCAFTLADAGELVWMEDPGYGGALSAFQAAQLKVVGKPVDGDGLRLTDADWRRPPRLIYTTPSHQYPLGAALSLPRRLALLAQARRHGSWVLEDDYDSEFRHETTPLHAMQGLETDAPVCYLGTFSKSLMPALRIGFLVVPPALISGLGDAAARLHPRGRIPEQRALAACLDSGLYLRHLRRMRRVYAERRSTLLAALQQHLGQACPAVGHGAGLHLCLALPPGLDDRRVAECAAARGVVVRPLSLHHVPGRRAPALQGLVLGYGHVGTAEIAPKVAQLAAALRDAARA